MFSEKHFKMYKSTAKHSYTIFMQEEEFNVYI